MANNGSQQETLQKFLLGGLSCMVAATITNPIDVIKIRLQLQGELKSRSSATHNISSAAAAGTVFDSVYGKDVKYKGFVRGVGMIMSDEGVRGLYKGLTPSLMREGSYSTLRMGGYEVVKDLLGATDPAHTPLWKKVLAGATSGAIGSAIANPTDLIKVRMQADGKVSPGQRRYRNTWHAFSETVRNEGWAGLYKGVGPTTYRAALLTGSQLPVYDHTKHALLNHGWLATDGTWAHFVSSMIAGFAAAAVTSPVDVVKTRIMNQQAVGAEQLYRGTLDCIGKTVKNEGVIGLYKGFFPNWMRIGPHTVITFVVLEKLRKFAGIRGI